MATELEVRAQLLRERKPYLDFARWLVLNGRLSESLPDNDLAKLTLDIGRLPSFKEPVSPTFTVIRPDIETMEELLVELRQITPSLAECLYTDPEIKKSPADLSLVKEGLPLIFTHRFEGVVPRIMEGVKPRLVLLTDENLGERYMIYYLEERLNLQYERGEEIARMIGLEPKGTIWLKKTMVQMACEEYYPPSSDSLWKDEWKEFLESALTSFEAYLQ